MKKFLSIFFALFFMGHVATAEIEKSLVDNVLIILDASGSMNTSMDGTTRMNAAKNAIFKVVSNLPQDTHVGLLVFSAKNMQDPWVHRLGVLNRQQFESKLKRIVAHASTPLGRFIGLGADELVKKKKTQMGYGTFRLLIVTDGQASDPDLMKVNTLKCLQQGVILDVIGVAMQKSHDLAKSSYSYRSAQDRKSLEKAISQVFAEVSDDPANQETKESFELVSFFNEANARHSLLSLSKMKANQGNQMPVHVAHQNHNHSSTANSNAPSATVAPTPSGGFSGLSIFIIVIVVIVAFTVLKKAFK